MRRENEGETKTALKSITKRGLAREPVRKAGVAAIVQQDQNQLRRYLLGQLTGADEEAAESRLLTDADYAEGLDMMVDELIDQYVGEEVSAEEREQIERHFLRSPERRDKLGFALALKRCASERKARRPRPRGLDRFYLPFAASLLLVSALGVGIWLAFFRHSDVHDGLAALRAAYGEQRPVEARLSDFPYARAEGVRGGEATNSRQRDLAMSKIIPASESRPKDAAAQHAVGLYYLATHHFDEAIKSLEASLSLDPRNAKAHSDLGVALLERGKSRDPKSGDRGLDFGESLKHFNRALELDDSLLEALFNRALAQEYLLLTGEAENDWRAYLAKDPGSQWAEEASQHLKALEEWRQNRGSSDNDQLLRDFYSAYERGEDEKAWALLSRGYISLGNAITNALLDSFIEARAGGGGDDKFGALEYAGRLESQRAGDAGTAQLVSFYRRASPARLRALARSRSLLREGYKRLRHSESAALRDLEQAKLSFDEAGDEYESALAEHLIGVHYFFAFDLVKTESIFQKLLTLGEGRGYAWLRGQSLSRLAMLRQNANKYSDAIEYDRRALEQFERAGDRNSTLMVLINLADEYQSLDDERQSLGYVGRAMAMAREVEPQPSQLWGIYTAAGLNFDSLDMSEVALAYQRDAVRLAQEIDQPLLISRSHAYLGITCGKLKLDDEALAHIGQAVDAGGALAEERSGQEMMANASLYAGEIYRRRGDADKAIESYDRAINFYAALNFPYFRYAAHRGKLLALLARNSDQSAESELRTVLGIFEQYRVDLTGEGQRDKFFDVEQGVYDRAIDFAYARKGDAPLAFDYSELSRARSLLDATRRYAQASGVAESRPVPGSAPLLIPEIQQRMPERAQVLQFAVLDGKLLAWLVTRTDVWSEEIPVGSLALGEKVEAYLRAAGDARADATGEAERGAKELYDILIRRFEPHLDKSKLLCVVPDKALHRLPFAALLSADTGRYMVEDYRIETAPSATVFVECWERAGVLAKSPVKERLLSVGNPAFDRAAFPTLSPLPSAVAEAKAITRFYKPEQSLLLLADEAREKAVVDALAESDVANFALHYVVDEESSLRSGMVLAGGRRGGGAPDGDDGLWQVGEIYKMRLPRTRLVVLSACRTGIEREYRGEGAMSAARPFVAAGVPLVVASLWPVNSESAARLITSFHKHRALDHKPTAEALRLAQSEMLKDERYRQPRDWAAFILIGGYAEF